MRARHIKTQDRRTDNWSQTRPIGIRITARQECVLSITEAQQLLQDLQAAINSAKEEV